MDNNQTNVTPVTPEPITPEAVAPSPVEAVPAPTTAPATPEVPVTQGTVSNEVKNDVEEI